MNTMTTTVTIGAGEQVWETLTPEDNEALLDWFRRNGLDPTEVRNDHEIVIANGLIDYWTSSHTRPADGILVEGSWTVGDRPDMHYQAPVVEEMDHGLAERVQALWVARVEKYAGIAGQVAAAQARAEAEDKVRREAGL